MNPDGCMYLEEELHPEMIGIWTKFCHDEDKKSDPIIDRQIDLVRIKRLILLRMRRLKTEL